MDKFFDSVTQFFSDAGDWIIHQPGVLALVGTLLVFMIVYAVLSDD